MNLILLTLCGITCHLSCCHIDREIHYWIQFILCFCFSSHYNNLINILNMRRFFVCLLVWKAKLGNRIWILAKVCHNVWCSWYLRCVKLFSVPSYRTLIWLSIVQSPKYGNLLYRSLIWFSLVQKPKHGSLIYREPKYGILLYRALNMVSCCTKP